MVYNIILSFGWFRLRVKYRISIIWRPFKVAYAMWYGVIVLGNRDDFKLSMCSVIFVKPTIKSYNKFRIILKVFGLVIQIF